jgi:hypothetical protein
VNNPAWSVVKHSPLDTSPSKESPTTATRDQNNARCLGCHYPLRGLESFRCPECGYLFDPADPTTMYFGDELNWFQKWWLRQNGTPIFIWAIFAFAMCLLLVKVAAPWPDEDERKPLILWCSLYAAAIVRSLSRNDLRRRYPTVVPTSFVPKKIMRTLWIISLAFALITCIDFYTCPHGTLAGFGGFGIAHSQVGGPCRNHYQELEKAHLFGDWYFWWV